MKNYNYEYRLFEYEGDWICAFPDLPGCSGVGDTPEEALADGELAKELWLDVYFEEHNSYPKPKNLYSKEYNGKILIRTTSSLHKDLVIQAENEGVSLNQYCCQLLAFGLGESKQKNTVHFHINYSLPTDNSTKKSDVDWEKGSFGEKVLPLQRAI
ncbi:MAG: type II toxin-antitoxin system HicB family antitoxin [Clostridiaceae bacterium]|nr:type II toxin-antitoxin system HicB family antitoxin [Clostridiaceae bacterium]